MSATPTPPSNKSSEPDNQDKQPPAAHEDVRDAKKRSKLSWLIRFLLVLLLLFALVCLAVLYMVGTDGGTEFLLDKVVKETGVSFNYGEGNLRDGLWVSDITLTPSDSIDVTVDKAYVKISWRAIFNNEVHLRDADIYNIYITRTKIPSGKPFDYNKIKMPVNLRLDHATIDTITYHQVTRNPLVFKDIEADKLSWLGTQLSVGDGNLNFAYMNSKEQEKQIVLFESLKGDITFDHDYPIDATAIAKVHSISRHYVDPIKIEATGSLKQLHGKLASNYNGYPITAEVDIEPVADGSPLTGTIYAKKLQLPYATDYDIQLDTSKIDVAGTWRELTFDVDTNLTASNIPSGHYLGQATWFTRDDKMDISKLTVNSDKGDLLGSGDLNWQDSFVMDLQAKSDGYQLDEVLPTDWQDFRGYLPKKLDGSFDLKYQHRNDDDNTQIDATVSQKGNANDDGLNGSFGGEFIQASIVRLAEGKFNDTNQSKRSNTPSPYSVTANWKNLYRKIDPELDVHNIGIIDSDQGSAQLYLKGKHLSANIDAQINELNAAPKGDYKVKLERNGYVMDIDALDYIGDVGDLVGSGQVTLPAKEGDPILWSLAGTTKGLKPNEYSPNIPIELVTGEFSVSDVMRFDKLAQYAKPNSRRTQHHDITIKRANVQTVLASRSSREIGFNGEGKFLFTLDDSGMRSFEVDYNGGIDDQNLANGNYQILAKGTPTDIDVNKLVYQGNAGKLDGSGKLILETNKSTTSSDKAGENMRWQVTADATEFDLASFISLQSNSPQTTADTADGSTAPPIPPIALTGKINTSGSLFTPTDKQSSKTQTPKTSQKASQNTRIKSSKVKSQLSDFTLQFDGEVLASKASTKPKPQANNKQATENPAQANSSINIPTGKLMIDATGNTQNITVNHIRHQGQAGFIDGKGSLDLSNGYQWQLKADMKAFNLGFFYPALASSLTGKIDTTGNWDNRKKQNNLTNFNVMFDGDVKTDSLPSGKLILNASSGGTQDNNNSQKITIKRIRHEGEAGFIDAKGTIDLKDGYQWQLTSEMKDFNLGYFIQDVPSRLSGNLATSGNWNDQRQQINITDMNISGDLKGKPLYTSGVMSADLTLPNNITAFIDRLKQSQANDQYQQASELIRSLNAQDVVAKWGNNTLTANGNKNQLETAINIKDLDQLYDKLQGELTGTISLKANDSATNTTNTPTLYVDLLAKQLSLPTLQLSNGKVKGKIVNLGEGESHLVVNASELVGGSTSFKDINAVFVGTESKHKLYLQFANEQMTFSGNLIGGLENREVWHGTLAKGILKSKQVTLSQVQPSEMTANFKKSELQLASHCWQAARQALDNSTNAGKSVSKLCLNDNLFVSQNRGSLDLTLQQVDTSLLSFVMPADIEWQSKVNGTTKVHWQKGKKPDVEATLFSDNGKIGLRQEDNSVSYIPYQRISLIGLTTSDGLKVRTDISSVGKGKAYLEATIDPYTKDKPINGTMSLDELNLAIFKPFFPGMRTLEGTGTMSGTIKGTLQKPLINGDLKLTGGRMSMLGLPINLSKVNAIAKIRNTQSTLEGTFHSGEGKGKLKGTIDWQNSFQAKIAITGEQLDIVQPPLLSAKINPDINIIFKPADKYVAVKGAVSVPSATIRPPEESSNEIKTSSDVTVLDRRQKGNIDEVLAITKPWSINADIGLDLGDNVNFRGFGAQLPLAGAMVFRQRGQGTMTSRGVVQVARRSNIDAFGQSLELNYAQFRFNGEVTKPNLSIEASKDIQSSTVGLRVKGDITDPEITVFNDAGLTEQQAMNALVTGRLNNESANQISEEGFRSEVTNNIAAAGLSIGLDTTRDLTNQIGRAVGLQSLTLSASGNNNDTNVNVTGYITPDLYIRYGIGVFSAQSQLSTRYQLTRNFYVEATSATEKFVDLVYSWEF